MKEFWVRLPFAEKVKFILSIIAGIAGVVFATLNWNATNVHVLVRETTAPLTVIIVFSMLIGYVFGYIPHLSTLRKKQHELDEVRSELDELKKM
jgi:uncharacterized integral membrane protein